MPLIIGIIIGLVLDGAILGWLLLVPVMWPSILGHVLFVAVVAAVVSYIGDKLKSSGYYTDPSKPTLVMGGVAVAVSLVAVLILLLAVPINNGRLRNLGNVEEVSERLSVADINHIRVNPKETAESLGNQVIGDGNLGSRFEVVNYDVQRVNGKIVWAAPLDFRGFWKWMSADVSPGYVLVSAEGTDARPTVATNYKMAYTPSAYWGQNLQRHLYFSGYATFSQKEVTFEVDDAGKPWYVVSMTRPTVGFAGDVLKTVVIVDPENGQFKAYEPGKTPEWVDRAFPEALAEDYAGYWGKYVHGFWNNMFAEQDVMKIPAGEDGSADVYFVYNRTSPNGAWVTGMTSPSAADNALTGYMSMDSITGKMKFYKIGSIGNETAALTAANGAEEIRTPKYRAVQPILYNIYGEDSWVVPALADNNLPKKVAIVYAANTSYVAVGDNLSQALDAYKTMLAEVRSGNVVPTDSKSTKKVTGTVVRIFKDRNGAFLILKEHPTQSFEVVRAVSAEILNTEVGDKVSLSYLDTTEEVVSVKAFDNLQLGLVKSEPQQELEAQEAAEVAKTAAQIEAEKAELQKQIDELNGKIEDTQ